MKHSMNAKLPLVVAACALLASTVRAQDQSGVNASAAGGSGTADGAKSDAAEMAKKLANPIGALISVPFQSNFDFGGGSAGMAFNTS